MGDYAGFIVRVEKNSTHKEIESIRVDLENNHAKGIVVHESLGLIVGIMKSSHPFGCVSNIMNVKKVEKFVCLSETLGNGDADYVSDADGW